MRLSTKLSIAYAMIIMIVASVLTFALYIELRQAQRAVVREHLSDIVRFTINQIDGDFHTLIVAPDDEQSVYYRITKEKLQAIQKTTNTIKHIYTLRQQQDGQVVVVVDIGQHTDDDQPTSERKKIGTPINVVSPMLMTSLTTPNQPLVEEDVVTNEFGHKVFYGYGPIRDQFGRQDGVMVIELDASMIIASENHARNTALIIFAVALPLALVIGIWRVRQLIAPVRDLVEGAEQISQGHLKHRVPVKSRDELGILAAAFNEMSGSLQARITAEQQAQQELNESHRQLQEYNSSLEQAIQEQQRLSEAIRQLSLPVIPIAEQIIMVPLVGVMDGNHAEDLVATILRGVEEHQARIVLLDLTGVLLIDDMVAQILVQAINATRLLGSRVFVLGIRPALAETLINLHVDLSSIETSSTLQSGLMRALALTGVRRSAS